ncbi:MAG: preprotein translocase subunit SecY [Sarcina sp.]
MLSTLRNAWNVPDLRKKILWTVFLVVIFRMGSHIPVPGIDTARLNEMMNSEGLLGFYNLISGGSLARFSIFALGVVPYINASIIMQLLTIAIPQLEQLSKEGEDGRKKIQNITRYSSIFIGVIMSIGSYLLMYKSNALKETNLMSILLIIISLVVGSTFLMWLGDQITVKGLGNGVSLIIFANIISGLPGTGVQVMQLGKAGTVGFVEIAMFVLGSLALLCGVIVLSLGERRITVHYAGKSVGNKVYKGQNTHIPLSIIGSTVIAIIFAMSVMGFPGTIARFFPDNSFAVWITSSNFSPFNMTTALYPICYAILTIFFTWFYTQITFKPEEMAENMHKSSGFIPGIRPGKDTAIYLEKLLNRMAFFGGIFAAIIAVLPVVVGTYTNFKGVEFGGTSLLILVSVALEMMRQLETQLTMRHYKGFLK